MNELQEYVDHLFRRQRVTPEIAELKEEILSNMMAKRDDLMAQGMDAARATQKAKESLTAVEGLIDGNQLTNVGQYRLDCMQSVLLACVVFWILSLPLRFTLYAPVCRMGLVLVILSGCAYGLKAARPADSVAILSVTASERRKRRVWALWGLFFAVATASIAALTFGSNIWFGRPPRIDGPYALANIASRFYLPLLTIIVPITFGSFSRALLKNRKEQEDV